MIQEYFQTETRSKKNLEKVDKIKIMKRSWWVKSDPGDFLKQLK